MMNRGSVPTLGKFQPEAACVPQRQPDVLAATEDLERSVNRLNEAVNNLWVRLERVLRQEPCEDKREDIGVGGECHTSRAIRIEAERVNDLVVGIERMIHLIEV